MEIAIHLLPAGNVFHSWASRAIASIPTRSPKAADAWGCVLQIDLVLYMDI